MVREKITCHFLTFEHKADIGVEGVGMEY